MAHKKYFICLNIDKGWKWSKLCKTNVEKYHGRQFGFMFVIKR